MTDGRQSNLSKGQISENDLLIAMMNIEDDISINLDKNSQKLMPKILDN